MWWLQTGLEYRLDAIGFAAIVIAIALGVRRWARRAHGVGLARSTWVALLLLLVVGMSGAEIAGEYERRRLQQMVDGIAPTYGQELTLLGHASLPLDAATDDASYLKMIDAQKRWLAANRNVADIYTMRRCADGQVRLVVDSETDYDRDGRFSGERESRTAIGEVFEDPDEQISAALAGTASFNAEPYTDRWGTWVSAYVPLRDADGSVEAIVGVDYEAGQWLNLIVGHRVAALGLVSILVIIQLATTVVVVITRAELKRRNELERERAALQEQLLVASRQAGMAEVATGVLHNVGNVLNSVNVSARMITDNLKGSRLPSLGKLADLISQEKARLGEFVTQDTRGRCLPDFLQQLHGKLHEDQQTVQKEVDQLVQGIEHIKEVVRMQQSTATDSNVLRALEPSSVMEDAIKVNLISMERHKVHLTREYEPGLGPMMLDKHKVLQILINLISNAKKATCRPGQIERHITLRVHRVQGGQAVRFEVHDNGVGIEPETASKLFRHGYSKFDNGHGFGLHSGANAATEMKGSLTAHSEGPGAARRSS